MEDVTFPCLSDLLAGWELLGSLLVRIDDRSVYINSRSPLVAADGFECLSFHLIFVHQESERLV